MAEPSVSLIGARVPECRNSVRKRVACTKLVLVLNLDKASGFNFEVNMKSLSRTSARFLLLSLLTLMLAATSLAQDRDITEGSSSGSIRSDVSERPSGPRRRMLSPESRAALVAEFELLRGAETLLSAASFEALKDDYKAALEKAASEKPIATDLTPLKYLVFKMMARDLSQKNPRVNADQLAAAMISTYIKTRDFMPPILSAGFSREEAKKAERQAVVALNQIVRQRVRSRLEPVATAQGGPPIGATTLTYGVSVNDHPRHAREGTPRRKGTVGLTVRIAPRFVVGITFDTFSSKKRADGSYVTGIGNTTPSLKYEALDDNKKHPSVSFSYSITLPTASVAKTLGSGRVDHKIIGDVGKKVGNTSLGLSLGYLFAGRKGQSGFSKTGLAVLSLAHPLGKRFTSKNEIDFATRADKNPSEIFAINQIVYKVNDTFSVRAGVRTGITVNSPRIGFTGGVIINGNLKKIFK
jgi:outer membrane putative beta-barrel porin/alpha-amylase